MYFYIPLARTPCINTIGAHIVRQPAYGPTGTMTSEVISVMSDKHGHIKRVYLYFNFSRYSVRTTFLKLQTFKQILVRP
jgi:hypothetical protein